jgi:ATP-binding cassette subfamily F protein 3
LARLLFQPTNLLILDEPTNHLDMLSKDVLKNALLQYDGTLVIVSHDRDFLQGLTNKVFEFKNHNIKEYIGDVYDFLNSRKIASFKELENNKKKKKVETIEDKSLQKKLWLKKKSKEKEERNLIIKISTIENKINDCESRINEMDKILMDPLKYKDALSQKGIFENYQKIKAELDDLVTTWDKLLIELEKIKTEQE